MSFQIPLSEAGRLGRLEHLVRLFNRSDLPRVDWLDPLTMAVSRVMHVWVWVNAGLRPPSLLVGVNAGLRPPSLLVPSSLAVKVMKWDASHCCIRTFLNK